MTAASANIESDSENDVSVAGAVAETGASGAGVTVVTSFLQNNNSAYIAGHVTTTSGDVDVEARQTRAPTRLSRMPVIWAEPRI